MKKLVLFLLLIGGLYSTIGSALVESGTKSIQSTNSRLASMEL